MPTPLSMKTLLFYIVLVCDLIICKKVTSDIKPGKLNECQQCKLVSNSFNHWLDKTSRGKYEGGDAAWEESKLKSYSRSEVRLVEIQEGLCSELKKHQDKCYSLAEEAESVLEKWWFHKDTQTMDFFTWLCIENLQYCCPKRHYGEYCNPCPVNKDNEICGSQGSCDGEGTRRGNGTCLCKTGYSGKYCEQCASNFYIVGSSCKPCHEACEECTGPGSNACMKCKSGWEMVTEECVDVNECLDAFICKERQFCTNLKGSYACKTCEKSCKTCDGKGLSNCTSCDADSALWSGFCVNNDLKSNILKNTIKRAAYYSGLLFIAFFVYCKSKSIASIIVLIIAIYIYYSESSSEISMLDVFVNLYLR